LCLRFCEIGSLGFADKLPAKEVPEFNGMPLLAGLHYLHLNPLSCPAPTKGDQCLIVVVGPE